MTKQQVDQLVNIITRYNALHVAADEAAKAIQNAKFEMFAEFSNKEDLDVLDKAMKIMRHISSNTHNSDAVMYFNKIQSEQQKD